MPVNSAADKLGENIILGFTFTNIAGCKDNGNCLENKLQKQTNKSWKKERKKDKYKYINRNYINRLINKLLVIACLFY